jgi:NAD(P)-dependent dehydrogenase (short-subunit alcohol dehydrogenase family)
MPEHGSGRERVAVVTGGSSGLGAAIARRLTREGWLCVLVARHADRLEAVARELGGEAEACDVAHREAVEGMAAGVIERHPAIRLLVNSAGIPGRRTFLTAEPELIERVVRVNYLGSVWCLRAFLPALEAARPADVVNIVSVAGTVAFPPSGPYSASKHAQLAFSRASAAELRRHGVRVHTVNPGFVETEGFPQRAVLRNPVMRRMVIQPDEVADHVMHVLRRDVVESFVPRKYRVAALAQSLAPGALGRLFARTGYRTIASTGSEKHASASDR